MLIAGLWRVLVVLLVVFSTLSARFATDTHVAVALVSENSEEKSISESDIDSLAEMFGAVATPLDGAVRVSVTRFVSDTTFHQLHITVDDVSARGPPRV
jgi:hypothetical protein